MIRPFFYFLLLTLLLPLTLTAHVLKGRVEDPKGTGISYATVYIKELKQGTPTNDEGRFELQLQAGSYTIIIQSLGYETQTISVLIPLKNPLTIRLAEKSYELRSISLSARGEDPAYMIMRKAIGMAPYYRNVVAGYTADVYLKTRVKLDHIKGVAALMVKKADRKKLAGVTMVQESINEITFTAPEQYRQRVKSVISATSIDLSGYGINENEMNAGMARFNIYGSSPSLPLAPVAFSNYKFVYEGDKEINGKLVNKIKVIPRRKSNDLLAGYLYIVDKSWNVYSADLVQEMNFGSLRILQNYGEVEAGILLPVSYNMEMTIDAFGVKGGGNMSGAIKYLSVSTNKSLLRQPTTAGADTAAGKTNPKKEKLRKEAAKIADKEQVSNSDMRKLAKLEQQLAALSQEEQLKAQGKEQSLELSNLQYVVEKDSNMVRNDTTLFQGLRPMPLMADEKMTYRKYDSIVKVNPRDSITGKALNEGGRKHSWPEILLSPTENRLKDGLSYKFSGLFDPWNLDFNTVDGFVYGLSGGLLKRDEKSGRRWQLNANVKWAFSRQVALWNLSFEQQYNPGRRAYWKIEGGQASKDFAGSNGVGYVNMWSSLLFRENYAKFHHDNYLRLSHRIDIINGLELFTALQWSDRRQQENNSDFSFFFSNSREYRSNTPRHTAAESTPALTADNRAALIEAQLSYTPEYYYRKRGEQKIMVRSDYPTLSLLWVKGLPDVFRSTSDFDFLRLQIRQQLRYGYYSRFNYNVEGGLFINDNNVAFADYRHFYGNEAYVSLSHNGAAVYQLLPQYTYSTNAWYLSANAHYRSPLLALKYLPFLANAPFDENLYAAYLLQPNLRHYAEVGYGLSLLQFMDVGVHIGLSAAGFYGWGFRLSMDLKRIREIVL